MKIRVITLKTTPADAQKALAGVQPKIEANTAVFNFDPEELTGVWVDPDGQIIHIVVASLTYNAHYSHDLEERLEDVMAFKEHLYQIKRAMK